MPITTSNLMIDAPISPMAWGEVMDLSNATPWRFTNAETGHPFAGAATGVVPGLLLFGFGVVRSGSADAIAYPAAITDQFEGILMATDSIEQRIGYSVDPSGRSGYPAPASGAPGSLTMSSIVPSVIRNAGRIAVPIETSVSRGDSVHMRCVLGAGIARGSFRNATVANETIQIPRARFITTVTLGSGLGVGLISLDGVI